MDCQQSIVGGPAPHVGALPRPVRAQLTGATDGGAAHAGVFTAGPASAPFSAFAAGAGGAAGGATSKSRVPVVVHATVHLLDTYRRVNPGYAYATHLNPRRQLSKGSGVGNDGWDNESSDLVIFVNDVLSSGSGRRYVVRDLLGQGTFGQVVKCVREETGDVVAVKVIKNQPAYYHQARVEIGILHLLNARCDPRDEHHIVRLLDYFVFRGHLCLVFELLQVNLYELLKRNGYKGLSLRLLRLFVAQVLDALTVLRDASVIHCDLKPENVLIQSLDSGAVKLIDYGSACFENHTVYSYIQSRFYRSPEVVLGHPYTAAIDMWSLGCVAAELYLGLPLFPGACEYNLLQRMTETLGPPPERLLSGAKHAAKYCTRGPGGEVELVPLDAFERSTATKVTQGKRYFAAVKLEDIIASRPPDRGASDARLAEDAVQRASLLDLLRGLLCLDPHARWTPRQAAGHPFLSGAPFTAPYAPPAEPLPTPPTAPASHPSSASASSVSSAVGGTAPSPVARSAPMGIAWGGAAHPRSGVFMAGSPLSVGSTGRALLAGGGVFGGSSSLGGASGSLPGAGGAAMGGGYLGMVGASPLESPHCGLGAPALYGASPAAAQAALFGVALSPDRYYSGMGAAPAHVALPRFGQLTPQQAAFLMSQQQQQQQQQQQLYALQLQQQQQQMAAAAGGAGASSWPSPGARAMGAMGAMILGGGTTTTGHPFVGAGSFGAGAQGRVPISPNVGGSVIVGGRRQASPTSGRTHRRPKAEPRAGGGGPHGEGGAAGEGGDDGGSPRRGGLFAPGPLGGGGAPAAAPPPGVRSTAPPGLSPTTPRLFPTETPSAASSYASGAAASTGSSLNARPPATTFVGVAVTQPGGSGGGGRTDPAADWDPLADPDWGGGDAPMAAVEEEGHAASDGEGAGGGYGPRGALWTNPAPSASAQQLLQQQQQQQQQHHQQHQVQRGFFPASTTPPDAPS